MSAVSNSDQGVVRVLLATPLVLVTVAWLVTAVSSQDTYDSEDEDDYG